MNTQFNNKSISGKKRQAGMSTPGWIMVFAIFAVLLMMFFKIFPMYYTNLKVGSALEAMAKDTSLDVMSKRAIHESLKKRLYIDSVKVIGKEHITVTRKDGKTTVTVTYEMRDDYMANIFIGAKFSETIVIDR